MKDVFGFPRQARNLGSLMEWSAHQRVFARACGDMDSLKIRKGVCVIISVNIVGGR